MAIEEHDKDEAKGRVKEAAGAVTGDEDLKNEGKADQAASDVKEGVSKVKDAANDAVDKVKGAFSGDDK